MKNSWCALVLMFSVFFASGLQAQKFTELDRSPHDISYFRAKNKEPLIKVYYGRPQKKGRAVFGELEPYGKVWRTGANESTEIRFFKDVLIGGKEIKAGTYSLFTIPEKEQWTFIINTDTDKWGAYDYDASKDVVRTTVSVETLPNDLEVLNILFKESDKGANLILAWERVKLELPIEIITAGSALNNNLRTSPNPPMDTIQPQHEVVQPEKNKAKNKKK